jgi:DNA-binding XRE family transcriptional regulator
MPTTQNSDNYLALPASDMNQIPKYRSGVYALWSGQECIYVGSSTNLYLRIGWHNHTGKFDRATWAEFPEDLLESKEREWFDRLSPVLNQNKIKRSQRLPRAWRWQPRVQKWARISFGAVDGWRRIGYCVVVERPKPGYHHPNALPQKEEMKAVNLLKTTREKYKFSFGVIAAVAGIDRSNYRKIELGIYSTSVETATKIANAFTKLTGTKVITREDVIFLKTNGQVN